MIEVFKTNIRLKRDAEKMTGLLQDHFPEHKANIDLHDRDKILRIQSTNISTDAIITFITKNGFCCEVLE